MPISKPIQTKTKCWICTWTNYRLNYCAKHEKIRDLLFAICKLPLVLCYVKFQAPFVPRVTLPNQDLGLMMKEPQCGVCQGHSILIASLNHTLVIIGSWWWSNVLHTTLKRQIKCKMSIVFIIITDTLTYAYSWMPTYTNCVATLGLQVSDGVQLLELLVPVITFRDHFIHSTN